VEPAEGTEEEVSEEYSDSDTSSSVPKHCYSSVLFDGDTDAYCSALTVRYLRTRVKGLKTLVLALQVENKRLTESGLQVATAVLCGGCGQYGGSGDCVRCWVIRK
jgi:hypothetical protein